MVHGTLLTRFVEAVLGDDAIELDVARGEMRRTLGDAAFVDACATLASFDAVVKLADGTGIPIEDWKAERTADLREALGINAMRR